MLSIETDGSRITAALSGDIDHHAARELRSELDELISRCRPDLLVFDMAGAGIMDSSGIGLILGRLRAVRGYGGDVAITNASDEIEAVIRLSGLSGLISEGDKHETSVT